MRQSQKLVDSVLAGMPIDEAISTHILMEASRSLYDDVTTMETSFSKLRGKVKNKPLKNFVMSIHSLVKAILTDSEALARRSISTMERLGKSFNGADLGGMLSELEAAKTTINSIRVNERSASDFIGNLFLLFDFKFAGTEGRSLTEALKNLSDSAESLIDSWFTS